MKKKKLSLNKVKVAKLQDTKMNSVIGGNMAEPTHTCRETELTCILTCLDPNSLDVCETSSPCFTHWTNCNTCWC